MLARTRAWRDLRSSALSHLAPYLLPLSVGTGIFLLDASLQNQALTAYILLFTIAFIFAKLQPYLIRWGMQPQTRKAIVAAFFVGAVLIFAVPVTATVLPVPGTTTGCSGLFGPISTFFSNAFTGLGTAAGTNVSSQVCNTFGMAQAIIAVGFVISLGVSGYQVATQGAEIRQVIIIPGVVLLVALGSIISQKIFIG